MADGPPRLSKTRFCQGLQCPKQLWWRVHEPEAPELVVGPALRAVFDRGHQVGEAARERFPGGVLVLGERREVRERVERTRRAMAEGAPAVFEAAFDEDGVFVAVDVLERLRRGFALAEVKSTLDVKEEHLPDVGIQLHVLRRAGLEVPRAEVMHLNRECRFPDLSNLFVRDDVTGEAEALLPGVPARIRELRRTLDGPIPNVEIGPHCTKPYPCPFLQRCWKPFPPGHVSHLTRLSGRAVGELLADGILTVHDLTAGHLDAFPGIARRQAESLRTGRTVVEPGLAEALAAIREPVAFLDFETVMPAIPAWPGCHPYDQVPVQMSCHVAGAGGALQHFAFLAEGPGDPRPGVAAEVARACEGARTVVAYNAPFERGCLERLAAAVPPLRGALEAAAGRLVDLLPIVRDHVYHPAFGGSFGMKRVLPALVPDLGYADLEIAEGGAASATLEALLLHGEARGERERLRLREQLLAYCERDTLGMVRLRERLAALA
jgi:hypothetical protein